MAYFSVFYGTRHRHSSFVYTQIVDLLWDMSITLPDEHPIDTISLHIAPIKTARKMHVEALCGIDLSAERFIILVDKHPASGR